jgi:hypothetical protein
LFYTGGEHCSLVAKLRHQFGGEMKRRNLLILVLLASALLLQACGAANPQAAIQTGIAQTLQIAQLQTAAAGGGGQQAASSTPEPGQTQAPTDTPTITLTSTASIPFVSVSQNTNCRTGPSQFYGLVTTINTNQQVEVLKTYSGANYVVVRNPNGSGDCWLWLQYANVTNFSSYNLPQATQPPTPNPTNTPTNTTAPYDFVGTWNVYFGGYYGYMNIFKSGNNISTQMVLDVAGTDYKYDISGSIGGGGQTASGTWELVDPAGGNGNFQWQIKSGNTKQFVGNGDSGVYEFCGWRSGTSQPSPCEWP